MMTIKDKLVLGSSQGKKQWVIATDSMCQGSGGRKGGKKGKRKGDIKRLKEVCVCIYIYSNAYIYVCMYRYIGVYVYICIHVYTYIYK